MNNNKNSKLEFTNEIFQEVFNKAQDQPEKDFAEDDLVCHRSHPRILKFIRRAGNRAVVLDKYQGIVTEMEFPLTEMAAYDSVRSETELKAAENAILQIQKTPE